MVGLVICVCVGSPGTAHAYSLKTTKTGQLVRWSEATIRLRVDPKLEAYFGKAEVHAALTMASDAWRGLPGVPQILVSEQAAPGYLLSKRTNGVYLMDPWLFPKDQLAVTVEPKILVRTVAQASETATAIINKLLVANP